MTNPSATRILSPMLPLFGRGGAVDPPVILLIALIADIAFGDPDLLWDHLPHPVTAFGKLVTLLESRLNRSFRTPRDRLVRGSTMAAGLTILAVLAGLLVTWLRRDWGPGWFIEAALVWMLLAQRAPFDQVRAVARALDKSGVQAGRRAASRFIGRDPDTLDSHGIARVAIESCAERFGEGVVAPVFWYLLFGAPGLFACRAIETMGGMIGPKGEFGRVATALDQAVNWVPARLAGLMLSAAALFTPRGRPARAFSVMFRDHRCATPPNSGWPEGAMAGALDLALAGPHNDHGVPVEAKWIGEGGRAMATSDDIRRALYLFAVACVLNIGLVLLVILAQG